MVRLTRTVLVIEDNEINREILSEILSPYYHVMQAENGRIGLELLTEHRSEISLILLDIQMPVMNGYEFLDAVRDKPHFGNIPIIVTTSSASATDEIKCLENGASDFVSKPYNMDVVLKRVESMIRLSEASAVINRAEYDALTGLYSKEFFFIKVEQALAANAGAAYDMICSDIEAFHVINERYGTQRGDQVLVCIAQMMKNGLPQSAICGRISSDVYAALIPHQDVAVYKDLADAFQNELQKLTMPNVIVHIGYYQNVDTTLAVPILCSNAQLAIEGIKHQYGKQLAEYNESVRQRILRERAILESMETALEERQFQVYYQPKHDLGKDVTGGAEALIRWYHPEMGFMNPDDFIPLFEKNSFIGRIDHYVRERVCQDLQEWIRAGKVVVPISMNVSRADFDDPDLVRDICQTADKYEIPHRLIHLEVTESIYTENPAQIVAGVNELRKMDFRIELDDFGAGYSSLTTLNDLDIDVLKVDRELLRNLNSAKQELILKHTFFHCRRLGNGDCGGGHRESGTGGAPEANGGRRYAGLLCSGLLLFKAASEGAI